MVNKNLLVELFVEELPPKALKGLGESFAGVLADSLKSQGLAGADAVVTPFASPRRLAVHVTGVAPKAADRAVEQKLMPAAVGLAANGEPTPALLKKLLGLNLGPDAVPRLKRRVDGKAEALFIDTVVAGATLKEGLQKALDETLAKLPIPKVMEYQLDDGWTSVNFVRPAHGLVALHGSAVVQCYALGLTSGRTTQGHRFEAAKHPIELHDADSYAEQLDREGAVIASFAARRAELEGQLKAAAAREGLLPIDDDALLDEVTALVERPNVLLCEFEPEFLDVPPECLILTMKANQKYFPLLDRQGKLTSRFLVVSNIRPADPSRVIEGNERVVRPRLADAKFFFDQDRKKRLADRVEGLNRVVYHGKLGTQFERTQRVREIAEQISRTLIDQAAAPAALKGAVQHAAMLAKADLLTEMVGEFPELQGVMGRYYARHDGLEEDIALAIEDHYKPRFAGDELPRNMPGVVVALADKMETLVGLFGIGERPTGDKDPFALRRHAIGVVRILVERRLELRLLDLVRQSESVFGTSIKPCSNELIQFLYERARMFFTLEGMDQDAVETMSRTGGRFVVFEASDRAFTLTEAAAVFASEPEFLYQVPDRLRALRAFVGMPEAGPLASANKRVGNILKKAGDVSSSVDPQLLKEPAEAALAEVLAEVTPRADAAFDRGDYTTSLQALAALKAPVDAFFDTVMVNTEDPDLRANRLGLLAKLHRAMNRVADLSRLAT